MPPADPEDPDVEQRLKDLQESIAALRQSCHKSSAFRQAEALVRLARRERQLIPLLQGQFELVNLAQDIFQHHRAHEVAIEMIALLENPERARQVQADVDERAYAETQAWMTACAYDNLAVHTAEIHGYNSEGMHQCIADGIAVCRRTGKLRCITCFREYATDVYRAADDLEMALHFARLGMLMPAAGSSDDRRWASASKACTLLRLQGELGEAEELGRRALEYAQTYHNPLNGRAQTLVFLEELFWQTGRGEAFETEFGEPGGARPLPKGEHLFMEHEWDLRDALVATCRGENDRAIDTLSRWDERLLRDRLLSSWCETRLRLIAACRLAGQQAKADALGRALADRARKARDWLTLRRLARLLDPAEAPTPTALLATPRVGPFAPAGGTLPADFPSPSAAPKSESPTPTVDETPPPLAPVFGQMLQRLDADASDQTRRELLEQVLALPPASFTDPRDVASFLYLLPGLLADDSPLEAVWTWAEQAAGPFQQTAFVVNLLALLADVLRARPGSPMSERIDARRVEALFRQSLDLDPDNASNHARAGAFYLRHEDLGEAERCLARGFRLQRTNSFLALRLAEIYQRTDRPRDALAVLDLCLREGSDDADVAWEAAQLAHHLGQFAALLTYLDRYDALRPDQPWVGFFRAVGLLEQGQPEKALESLAREEAQSPERPFGIAVLRACAASALGRPQQYREYLDQVLAFAWSDIDYFTLLGLTNLAGRLWKAAACLPADDDAVSRLAQRLLQTGLAPEEVFEPGRLAGPETAAVKYYRCALRQPLDEHWPKSPGCLHGQAEWRTYFCLWGVLAPDEEEAGRLALAQQAACYDREATVEQVEDLGQQYTDKPGVVWQGARWNEPEADGNP